MARPRAACRPSNPFMPPASAIGRRPCCRLQEDSSVPINLDPVVAAGNTLSYTENQPAATISPLAVVTDADSADFNTGTLTVSLGASGTADDFLVLIDQGTGAGQIGVSGSTITYQ